jgi:hypothetical protein
MFLFDRSLLVSVKISLCLVIGNILICDRSGEFSRNQTLCTDMTRRCEVLTAATLKDYCLHGCGRFTRILDASAVSTFRF